MNTHDIELPQGYRDRPWDYDGDLYTEGQVRAIIEADRQRRGGPVQALLQQARRVRNYSDPDQVFEAVPVSAFDVETAPQPDKPVKVPALSGIHEAIIRFADARAGITEARCENMSYEQRRLAADDCAQAYADLCALLSRYSSG